MMWVGEVSHAQPLTSVKTVYRLSPEGSRLSLDWGVDEGIASS